MGQGKGQPNKGLGIPATIRGQVTNISMEIDNLSCRLFVIKV